MRDKDKIQAIKKQVLESIIFGWSVSSLIVMASAIGTPRLPILAVFYAITTLIFILIYLATLRGKP